MKARAILSVLMLVWAACRDSTTPALDQLAFITEPTDAVAGSAFGRAIRIEIRDPNGYPVAGADAGVTLSVGANPGGAVLAGTLTRNAVNGVATFSDVRLDKAGTGYTLSATAPSMDPATSVPFSVSPGAAARLRFLAQPDTAEGQAPFSPAVQVAIEDAFDNVVTDAVAEVTVALLANPAGVALSGITTVAAANGLARFDALSMALPGDGYVLRASSAGLTSASSAPFSVRITLVQVDAGGLHSCGVTVTSVAYCWGGNASGQLGDGTTTERVTPTPVAGNLRFMQVSTGYEHTCGITSDGVTYCWGRNDLGELGDGSNEQRPVPTPVAGGLTLAQVSGGSEHTCGVTTDAVAYCWGRNDLGQLGDSTTAQRGTPTAVAGALRFRQISARIHTCAVTPGNVAYCWGRDVEGQLGDGTPIYYRDSPTPVAGNLTFTLITVGDFHTCGLSTGKEAYCWGEGWGATPAPISSTLIFARLDAGSRHTCGVTTGNLAYCWGDNIYGQLGDGTTDSRAMPTPVAGGLTFTLVTAGNVHTCGVTTGKVAYCWGYNSFGGLGDGTTQHRFAPVRVAQ